MDSFQIIEEAGRLSAYEQSWTISKYFPIDTCFQRFLRLPATVSISWVSRKIQAPWSAYSLTNWRRSLKENISSLSSITRHRIVRRSYMKGRISLVFSYPHTRRSSIRRKDSLKKYASPQPTKYSKALTFRRKSSRKK